MLEQKIFDQTTNNTYHLPTGPEYLAQLKQNNQPQIAEIFSAVLDICEAVKKQSGKAYIVGGCVRDLVVGGKQPKDFDLEIFGLNADQIQTVLLTLFSPDRVKAETGKAFGVTKVMFGNGMDIDISLPRKDSKNGNGNGHKDFDIKHDPQMSQLEASKRRDFTMNSLSWDPLLEENNISDYFDGVRHLQEKRLKITNDKTFGDDPLRVLRAVQFAGRHELTIDETDIPVYQQSCQYLSALPAPRLVEEWKKLFLKSRKPSFGLKAAADLGLFQYIHPQFQYLIKNNNKNHKWDKTLLAVDQAADMVRRENLPDEQIWPIMVAALCHQLPTGRPLRLDDLDISNSHQQSNIEEKNNFLRLSFLDQLQIDNGSRARVTKLLSYQTIPEKIYQSKVTKKNQAEIDSLQQNILQNNPAGQFVSLVNNTEIDGLYNRLSVLLHPVTINELSILVSATSLESNQSTSFKAAIYLHNHAEKHQILHRKATNPIDYRDFKHTQIKSTENGKSDHENISRIINVATELINTNGYTPAQILKIVNSEPSTLADKYLKLEKLFCQNLTHEQRIKRLFPFKSHEIIKRYLLELQPQENEMRQIRQNYVRQYKNPPIDKDTINKITIYNNKFIENFDEQNHHESDWHQFGIYSHSVEVAKLLKKIPTLFKANQELTKSLDDHFSETIDGISKKELFNLSGYLHDLGKYSARRIIFEENEQGNKKIKLKTNGHPNFTFKGHELDSSKIILEDINTDLVNIGLTDNQIKYIAECAKLHYELGKLREIGKKTVTGFNQEFIDSELFAENALEIIGSNEDFKFEIGLFFLADSLGKYSRKLHKYRHLDQSTNSLSKDDLDFDLNFMNLTHTKAKNGIAQINPNLAAGKRYLSLCLQSETI